MNPWERVGKTTIRSIAMMLGLFCFGLAVNNEGRSAYWLYYIATGMLMCIYGEAWRKD